MTLFQQTQAAYCLAWDYLAPFTLVHLALRLLTTAVILPATGLVLTVALSLQGQAAMTDQDIARFLLTPAGFAGGLAILGLSIIASALDLVVMTQTLRQGEHRASVALLSGMSLVIARFRPLFSLGIRLTLRVLMIAVPFLVVAAGIAWITLSDYDINYYLTYRPPVFLLAASLIGALAVGLAVVLGVQLARWAVALHFLLFQRANPQSALALSATGLRGQHWAVIRRVLAWGLVRMGLATMVATIGGLLIAGTQELFELHLRLIVVATLTILALWWLADAVVSALANGALAALLNDIYQGVGGESAAVASEDSQPTNARLALALSVLAIAVGLILVGLDTTGDGLERVGIQRQVAIIAHRGAAGARPENTLASVNKAFEDHADWVEIDVQETADGEVIVAHDSDFMKQAGDKRKVWNVTRADLTQIDIGSWFDPAYATERPPTLRQVLLAAKDRGKVLIELKYYGHNVQLEERVARIVDDTGMNDDVASMSLKRRGVEIMQALRPDWPHGILAATAIGNLAAVKADFLALNTGQITLPLIRRAQAQGKHVYAWTVDEPVTMVRLISMGIDGLITNEPALARAAMNTRNQLSTLERLVLWLTGQFDLDRLEFDADTSDA